MCQMEHTPLIDVGAFVPAPRCLPTPPPPPPRLYPTLPYPRVSCLHVFTAAAGLACFWHGYQCTRVTSRL